MSKQPTPILLFVVGAIAFVAGAVVAAALFLGWRPVVLALFVAGIILWCAYMAFANSSIPRGRAGRPVRATAKAEGAPVAGADNAAGGAKRDAAGAGGAKAGPGQRGAASPEKKRAAVPAVGTRDRVPFRLRELMVAGTESVVQIKPTSEEIRHLQRIADSFFAGGGRVLEAPSGDLASDRLRVMAELYSYLKANSAHRPHISKELEGVDFTRWADRFASKDTSAQKGHICCLRWEGQYILEESCYDGGCGGSWSYVDTQELNIDIVSEEAWESAIVDAKEWDVSWYDATSWRYEGTLVNDDALVVPTRRSLFMHRPFGSVFNFRLCWEFGQRYR